MSGDNDVCLVVQEGFLSHRRLTSCFPEDREAGQSILAPAVSQVTLIQHNQYATLAYFGVTCPETHHMTTQRYPVEGLFLLVSLFSSPPVELLFHWPELHHILASKPVTVKDNGITMIGLDRS